MSRRHSYYACLLSIQWLFRPADQRQLGDPPAPKGCRLWTWTFPDAVTRGDPVLAMKRWNSWRNRLHDRAYQYVRVLERGEKGAFHFHTVTPEWWDVNELRPLAERHGFGRVNVKEIPVSSAAYVAKYLLKGDRKWVPAGMRLWACGGFDGCSSKNLRYVEKITQVVPDTGHDKLYTVLEWWVGETVAFRHRYRPNDGQPDVIRKMELKPAQSKEIVSKLASGVMLAVGEFRGVQVRTQKWQDKRTNQEKSGVVIEYSVELGGMGRKVTEWAPDGVKESDVVVPKLTRGEIVAVIVQAVKTFKGEQSITGKVTALPVLV